MEDWFSPCERVQSRSASCNVRDGCRYSVCVVAWEGGVGVNLRLRGHQEAKIGHSERSELVWGVLGGLSEAQAHHGSGWCSLWSAAQASGDVSRRRSMLVLAEWRPREPAMSKGLHGAREGFQSRFWEALHGLADADWRCEVQFGHRDLKKRH